MVEFSDFEDVPAPAQRLEVGPWGPPIEVKSAEHWRFQWHEEVLKRSDLPRSSIAVAGVLMHRYRPERGYAEIGSANLAKQAGCWPSTAKKAIAQLEKLGLVVVINRGSRSPDGSLAPHQYRLTYISRGAGSSFG